MKFLISIVLHFRYSVYVNCCTNCHYNFNPGEQVSFEFFLLGFLELE